MIMKSIALGSVVFSRSGRDAGRFYVVIEIVDDEYVTIADGDLRRVDKPKLKKIKLEERHPHIPQEKDRTTIDYQMGEVHGGNREQI